MRPNDPLVSDTSDSSRLHALSFGQAADLYDSARPTYPAEALRWALGNNPLDIVDLGAGTGLLTRKLIAAGHRVSAVDPDRDMIRKLIDHTEGLTGHHIAGAEDLELPESRADAVTAGQAYHWFNPEEALPRIRQTLRPGGIFCPLWNVRDGSVGWVSELTNLVGSSAAEILAVQLAEEDKPFGNYFAASELRIFRHSKPLTAEGLHLLVQSRSHYITADDKRKREIVAGVDELLRDHPDLNGAENFAMPYSTYVFRAEADEKPLLKTALTARARRRFALRTAYRLARVAVFFSWLRDSKRLLQPQSTKAKPVRSALAATFTLVPGLMRSRAFTLADPRASQRRPARRLHRVPRTRQP